MWFLELQGIKITPWFKLIAENFLYGWWEELEDIENKAEDKKIHRL
jgi:isopentenyl-diphosphate delta-isomerase